MFNKRKWLSLECFISIMLILCMLASSGVINTFAASDIGALGVLKVQQSKTKWCWAACAESILRYHGKSVSQSSFAAYVLGSTPAPNQTAYDEEVLEGLNNWDVTGTYVPRSISFSTISSNVNSNRPIYVGWTWTGGTSGHAVVINGFSGASASTGYVEYMDPWDGDYYVVSYNSFKGGSSYNHIWDGTIYAMREI